MSKGTPAGELTDAQIKELFVQMHAAGDNWPQFARAVIAAHEAAQPAPMAAEAWAELHTLRLAVQGPDGFATWQDAAVAERVRRVKAEAAIAALRKDALRLRNILLEIKEHGLSWDDSYDAAMAKEPK